MTLSRLVLLCATTCLLVPAPVLAAWQQVRFTGQLTQPAGDGAGQILRRFEVLLLTAEDAAFFSVLDDEREGCPWPESFGTLTSSGNTVQPHLLYSYQGAGYTLPLPPLQLDLPADVAPEKSWTANGWTFEVTGRQTVDGVACLEIAAAERRGRRQSLLVEAASGLLRQARQDVFMGQGDQFELTLNQTQQEPLTADVAESTRQLISRLRQLQDAIGRRPDAQTAELSPRQLEVAEAAIPELRALAQNTPLQETVVRIAQDVARQQRRVAQTMDRQQQLLNQSAPEFSLNLVGGETLSSDSLAGRTVVLHFWNYADKPLTEPYGQIGYLEFLASRQEPRLAVVGVATNPELQQADSAPAARRSARKLMEFMNLSYPVGYDDGSLLRDLGDPREAGGELPLWVVLSPEGKIVHYRSGFYEIDRQRGLKELEEIVSGQSAAE